MEGELLALVGLVAQLGDEAQILNRHARMVGQRGQSGDVGTIEQLGVAGATSHHQNSQQRRPRQQGHGNGVTMTSPGSHRHTGPQHRLPARHHPSQQRVALPAGIRPRGEHRVPGAQLNPSQRLVIGQQQQLHLPGVQDGGRLPQSDGDGLVDGVGLGDLAGEVVKPLQVLVAAVEPGEAHIGQVGHPRRRQQQQQCPRGQLPQQHRHQAQGGVGGLSQGGEGPGPPEQQGLTTRRGEPNGHQDQSQRHRGVHRHTGEDGEPVAGVQGRASPPRGDPNECGDRGGLEQVEGNVEGQLDRVALDPQESQG